MDNRRSDNISGSVEVAGNNRYQPGDVLALKALVREWMVRRLSPASVRSSTSGKVGVPG